MYNDFRELKTDNLKDANVLLGSAIYDLGCSCGSGTSLAPKKLKDLSKYLPPFDANFHNLEKVKIYDYCEVKPTKQRDFYDDLEKQATSMLQHNKFMLFLGGDHSISIPLEKAFYHKYHNLGLTPVIIHIDAHMDILDEYMGSNMSHACPNRRAIDLGYLAKDIHMVGIRSYEKGEVEFKEKHPELDVFTADLFRELGPKEIVKRIKEAHDEKAVYYVSFDIDAIDPAYAPGTGTPESFGLTPLEMRSFLKEVFLNLNVQAMDLVEISPSLDINDITSWLGLKLLYEVFYYKFVRNEK